MTDRTCTIEGCGKPLWSRGLCNMHYARWRKRGTTDAPERWTRNRATLSMLARFDRVAKPGPPDECWRWPGRLSPYGYGRIRDDEGNIIASHRVAYARWVGPLIDGLVIDHLCRNRACWNPAHLEQVTDRVNVERGENPSILIHLSGRCARGHDRSIHGYARKDRPGSYNCRECKREDRAATRGKA